MFGWFKKKNPAPTPEPEVIEDAPFYKDAADFLKKTGGKQFKRTKEEKDAGLSADEAARLRPQQEKKSKGVKKNNTPKPEKETVELPFYPRNGEDSTWCCESVDAFVESLRQACASTQVSYQNKIDDALSEGKSEKEAKTAASRSGASEEGDEEIIKYFESLGFECRGQYRIPCKVNLRGYHKADVVVGGGCTIETKFVRNGFGKNSKNGLNALLGEFTYARLSGHPEYINQVSVYWEDCGITDDYIDSYRGIEPFLEKDGMNILFARYNKETQEISFPFLRQPEDFLNHEQFVRAPEQPEQ